MLRLNEMLINLDNARHDARDRGAAAVEYGLLVFLIAVAIMGTLLVLGGRLNTIFQQVVTALGG